MIGMTLVATRLAAIGVLMISGLMGVRSRFDRAGQIVGVVSSRAHGRTTLIGFMRSPLSNPRCRAQRIVL